MARCRRSPVQNRLPSVQSESRGFGVKTRSSSGSSLTVKGLESAEFLPCPMKIVSKSSSLTSASPSTAKIARFAYLIIDSKTPPKCGAAGWFHFQLIPLLEVIRSILSWSIAGTRPCSSLDALTNFVPPSILSAQSFWQRRQQMHRCPKTTPSLSGTKGLQTEKKHK